MAQTNHADELDQLLDSALDDFRTLNLTSSVQRDDGVKRAEGSSLPKGLGMGLPDLSSKRKEKQKESHVLETLNKLREQTKETVKGLESIASIGYEDDAMIEDWVKQFEELTCSQEVESMMETMMQQLLLKQVLHEPMKEIEEKCPKWLHDNKSKLDKKEYDRYLRQHHLNAVYESEPGNFNKITELMQKMQECGQPPDDIVKEIAPDFDTSTLAHISPEMLASQQNCCIM